MLHITNQKAGFVICMRGTREIIINGVQYRLTAGMAHIISPALVTLVLEDSDDFESIGVEEDVSLLFPATRKILPILLGRGLIGKPVVSLPEASLRVMEREHAEIESVRRQYLMAAEDGERQILRQLLDMRMQSTIVRFMHQCFFLLPQQQERRNIIPPVAVNFLLSVQRNFYRHRSVAWYAAEANLSTGYFSSIIRDAIGRTPSRIIHLCTIQNAKLLLDNTQRSVKEISREIGFPEQFSFRKYFKTHTGLSPTEYRKRAK